MFDPHRTRRNDRRFYTKKGQIIQAKNISAPFNIEGSKVDAYKEYIIKNNLISIQPPSPPSPDDKINIAGVFFVNSSGQVYKYPISSMTRTTDSTINYSNNTGMRGGVIIALYKDTDGVFHLTAAGVQNGVLTLTIEGNAECRYIYTTNWAPAPAVWSTCVKGIFTNDDDVIISAASNMINFTQYARLDFN